MNELVNKFILDHIDHEINIHKYNMNYGYINPQNKDKDSYYYVEKYENFITSNDCDKLFCSDVYKEFLKYCKPYKYNISQKKFIEYMKKSEIDTIKIKNRLMFLDIKMIKVSNIYILPEDYGKKVLIKIKDGNQFFSLLDNLYQDEEKHLPDGVGFRCNRSLIANAFKEGRLYGLTVEETDEMYKRKVMEDEVFRLNKCNPRYLLPCFCIMCDDCCEMMWVRSDIRNQGLGKKFVELINIKRVYKPLPRAVNFWKKHNITEII